MDKRIFATIFATIIAVILAGQILAYVPLYHSSADAWRNDDCSIGYSVDTNASSVYTASLFGGVDTYSIERVLIYYDPEYPAHHSDKYLEDKIMLTVSELRLRNSPETTVVNAEYTKETLLHEIESGTYRTALLMMTGVFPDTIYNGTADSPIVNWLKGGGVLYWLGDIIGTYVACRGESILSQQYGYGEVFFGSPDCVIASGKINYASDPSPDSDVASSLGISYNITTFGINTRYLEQYISIGYTKDGYDSLVLTKFHSGEGMIAIFGGDASSDAAPTLAQTVCSMVNYSTSLIHTERGTITMGTACGLIQDTGGTVCIYICIGTPLVTYARSFNIGKA
ncbi:MAG: hypothetical protein LBJ20_08215 [Candidatus Methanoplasma sp.]|nr:hypothetical protein [Candidatus Methanoplasma sp.]